MKAFITVNDLVDGIKMVVLYTFQNYGNGLQYMFGDLLQTFFSFIALIRMRLRLCVYIHIHILIYICSYIYIYTLYTHREDIYIYEMFGTNLLSGFTSPNKLFYIYYWQITFHT